MSFNTLDFLLFLPLVLTIFSLVIGREHLRDATLLAFSYLFYMAWYWEYVSLLAMSTLVDYVIARGLTKTCSDIKRKALLVTSLTLNLGVLGIFKYYDFFVDLSTRAVEIYGVSLDLPRSVWLLPVGISFYTFQSLSYTIDVYRRSIPAEPDLVKFALFVSFFPQLVAGPIVRASDFLPQLRRPLSVTRLAFNAGVALIFVGLLKKVLIADTLGVLVVDEVFRAPADFSSVDLLVGVYAYAFQIYGDFSGYSDIAIGSAATLGFWLPPNFNRPYLAQNIREFWGRWHISLSTWLRDYLYISLGGNRGGRLLTSRNLLITMLLGGLWHGAALNFVAWGLWHGILLMLARSAGRNPGETALIRVWLNRFITFHLVCFGWLLFRVSSWQQFAEYTQGLLKLDGGTILHPLAFAVLASAIGLHLLPKRPQDAIVLGVWPERTPQWLQAGVYAALLLVLVGFTVSAPAFIYFQF